MAEPKWTPGPWEWRMHERYNLPALYGANGEVVMHFGDDEPFYPVNGQPPNPHNSALIAAAPDLYEACEKARKVFALIKAFDDLVLTPHGVFEEAIDAIDLALRKARGESDGD